MLKNKTAINHRYYEDIGIDFKTRESNYTQMLTNEALDFLTRMSENQKQFFLYWAPDSTHAPTYAAKSFLKTSRRGWF